MENIMKKSVAIIALAALIIAVTCCFAFSLPLNAEESVVWDKIEIEPSQVGESSNTYNIDLSEIRSEYRYVYIYVVGAGGAGDNGKKQAVGNGGGAGGFGIYRVDTQVADNIAIVSGFGGGRYRYDMQGSLKEGEGALSEVIVSNGVATEKAIVYGGEAGNTAIVGVGGSAVISDKSEFNMMEMIYSRVGSNGGENSSAFTVDFGFRKEYFILRLAGASPSGRGGAASVYRKGGDGGIIKSDGADANYGAGGGGAGYAAAKGGKGGNGYVEVFGSNM